MYKYLHFPCCSAFHVLNCTSGFSVNSQLNTPLSYPFSADKDAGMVVVVLVEEEEGEKEEEEDAVLRRGSELGNAKLWGK